MKPSSPVMIAAAAFRAAAFSGRCLPPSLLALSLLALAPGCAPGDVAVGAAAPETLTAALPISERAPAHHSGGEQPLRIHLRGPVTQQRRVIVEVESHAEGDRPVRWLVQILDVAGNDVHEPITGRFASVRTGAARAARRDVDLPALPDGYYHLRATALAHQRRDELIGDGQAFILVERGNAAFVAFSEWYINSGAETFGGRG